MANQVAINNGQGDIPIIVVIIGHLCVKSLQCNLQANAPQVLGLGW